MAMARAWRSKKPPVPSTALPPTWSSVSLIPERPVADAIKRWVFSQRACRYQGGRPTPADRARRHRRGRRPPGGEISATCPPPPPLPHRPPPSARPHRRSAALGVCAPGAARLARARLVRRSPRRRTPRRAAQVGGRRGSAGDRQLPSPLGGRGHGGGRRPPWGTDTPSLTAPPAGRPADRPADGVAGGARGAPPGAAAAANAAAAARPRLAHPAMDAVLATAHDWPRCRRRCAGGRR
ncbi:hypothetical protein BU14_0158s0003 [Porphyra umbilicalis]|uniref:Uncharacterized protein n=1 Tax=Porphyra umbilicalis TaxID=2786 RepID=A0A1X6P8L6_PORUM|nr:hypothetical protein BU14_0158s0003 [Porphyra umbilicalis]|eukprot:OSX77198.1 hypothetical protein BU14_0158s0003 [Porphyra umbilicalis]